MNDTNRQPSNIGQNELRLISPLTEDILALCYLQAKSEGLLGAMFWEKPPSLKAFLDWCARPNCLVIGCYKDLYLAGIGWLDNIKARHGKRYADCGELFFRDYQARSITAEFGRMMVSYVFDKENIAVLYGLTPEKNIAALQYMKSFGFTHLPPVPGLCSWMGEESSGVASYLEKETWEAKKTERIARESPHLQPV